MSKKKVNYHSLRYLDIEHKCNNVVCIFRYWVEKNLYNRYMRAVKKINRPDILSVDEKNVLFGYASPKYRYARRVKLA